MNASKTPLQKPAFLIFHKQIRICFDFVIFLIIDIYVKDKFNFVIFCQNDNANKINGFYILDDELFVPILKNLYGICIY